MSNLALYLDTAAKQLVKGITTTAPAKLPVFYRGDKIGIDLFFLQPTGNAFAPYEFVSYTSPGIKLGIGLLPSGAAVEQDTWAAISGTPSATVTTVHSGDSAAVTATVTNVQDGDGSVHEVQKVTFSAPPIAGFFSIGGFDDAGNLSSVGATGKKTPALSFDADSTLVVSALNATTPMFGWQVQAFYPGISFEIVFVGDLVDHAELTVETSNLIGGGTHEKQKISFSKDPIGGTYTLTFTEGTTAPIAWNANSDKIEAAINAILGKDAVAVTGDALSSFFLINWADYVDHSPVTISTTSLIWNTGGYTATLDLVATDIDTLLAGETQVKAILEIEVTLSSKPETLLHAPCTVSADLIT